jgi:hypothetical protein
MFAIRLTFLYRRQAALEERMKRIVQTMLHSCSTQTPICPARIAP